LIADGSVAITADSSEDISTFSVAAGGGSSVGVAVAADVFVLTLDTNAAIASNATVKTRGSVLVSAHDETELDVISGGVAVGGSAGVGAGIGVVVVDKSTTASIGAGAHVSGAGVDDTVAARTGEFQIGYGATLPDGGPNVEPDADGKASKESLEIGSAQMGGGDTDFTQDGSSDMTDPSLTRQRTATADPQAGFRGVAVTATNKDDIETLALSVAGAGSVAVAVGAAVNVVDTETSATIGAGAHINQAADMLTSAHGAQSVRVAAGNDFYHMGIGAGVAVGGSGAGAPGV